ncbi:MAG: TolC family protein [Candidatus Azobacteroides sp.]|nr:TolC family protein [Candidatus Azobacteroides sp.]
MKKSIFQYSLLLFAFACCLSGYSQTITFREYLNNVKNNNIRYLVEKYNVDIADADIQAAKVFPDPELSLSATDNQQETLKMGYSFDAALDYTLELGGKRKARIRLAQSQKALADAQLEDFFRNLRADAVIQYSDVLKQKQLLDISASSYYQMKRLADADSIRFKLGEITETDAMQSKLEANSMWNELEQNRADYKNAMVELSVYQGDKNFTDIDSVSGELTYSKHEYNLSSLIIEAQNNRADLQAALLSKDVSAKTLQLARANRAIDLGLTIGATHNTIVKNEIAPAPAFTGVTAGISIPLKFSNSNKGEIKAAQYAVKQSEVVYDAVEMQISKEVIQAYHNYVSACLQVEQFRAKLLSDAETILRNKTYGYQRGETTLLDVLNARRTYNDIYRNYCETLYNSMVSLIELERACGIWDVEL